MARLVLSNPGITAREMAQTMGYAEQKSVYYWLRKAGFVGIKDFRKAVLSGTFPIRIREAHRPLAKDAPSSLGIPVHTGGTEPVRANLEDYMAGALSPGSFAFPLSSGRYGPLAREGDLLIVDPEAPVKQGDLVVGSHGGQTCLARRYWLPDKAVLYVDATDHACVLSPDYITGKVIFILRKHI